MSIALIVKFPKQVCTISKQFNNLFPAKQVQMMYTILDKEKTQLHIMIRAIIERINIIS